MHMSLLLLLLLLLLHILLHILLLLLLPLAQEACEHKEDVSKKPIAAGADVCVRRHTATSTAPLPELLLQQNLLQLLCCSCFQLVAAFSSSHG
jgi:hypothetical protein